MNIVYGIILMVMGVLFILFPEKMSRIDFYKHPKLGNVIMITCGLVLIIVGIVVCFI